jgi:hypothetical protein
MSYDLSLFRAARELSLAEAELVHGALCSGEGPELAATAEEALGSLYDQLTKRFPELDVDEESSPFSSKIDRTRHGLVVSIVFSQADDVKREILGLARPLGLVVYDPQAQTLHRPDDPVPPPVEPRLQPKQAERDLVAGIGPYLRACGFEHVTRPKGMTFRRATGDGVVQQFELARSTSKDVRAFVRIDHSVLGRRIAELLRKPQPVSLVFADLLGPYRDRDGTISDRTRGPDCEYAICHATCLTRAIDDSRRAFERFAVPFFRGMESLAAIDAAYHGDPGSALPRYLQFGIDPLPRFVFVGTAVGHAVRRPDLADWVARYRERIASWGEPSDRSALRQRYDSFVAALGA